jgi:hypothetical protein
MAKKGWADNKAYWSLDIYPEFYGKAKILELIGQTVKWSNPIDCKSDWDTHHKDMSFVSSQHPTVIMIICAKRFDGSYKFRKVYYGGELIDYWQPEYAPPNLAVEILEKSLADTKAVIEQQYQDQIKNFDIELEKFANLPKTNA